MQFTNLCCFLHRGDGSNQFRSLAGAFDDPGANALAKNSWPPSSPGASTVLSPETAQANWNARPVAAILISGSTDATPPGRHWAETEYVVDDATGLLTPAILYCRSGLTKEWFIVF